MGEEKDARKGMELIGRRGRFSLTRFETADGATGYLLEEAGTLASSEDGDEYDFHEHVGMVSGEWELFMALDRGRPWAQRIPVPAKTSCLDHVKDEPATEEPENAPEDLDAEGLFGPVLFAYTRKQALADGVLVDVSETAKEAGFRIPVALTRAVWAEQVEAPEGVERQDEAGRLWDVLWMARYGITQGKNRDASEILFSLQVRNDNREGEPPLATLKAVCGPDDDAEPCITIMLPEED